MSEQTQLRGLLFDWDGTIVDSYQPMFQSIRYAYKKHLDIIFPKDEEEFRKVSPMRLAESTALYAGEQADQVAESYLWYYMNEGYKAGRVFPGLREVLQELRRRGFLLGVVTNTSLRRMQIDMQYLHLDGAFDLIVTSEDTTERKPHPAPLLRGAEKAGLTAEQVAYIGDYPGDIIAARSASMVSVAALWGGIFLPETVLAEDPVYTAKKPEELLALFPSTRDYLVT